MMLSLIEPILVAAGKAIAAATREANDGNQEAAERIVKKFVAASQLDLDEDMAEAYELLEKRFE
jgi:hypothetical protein